MKSKRCLNCNCKFYPQKHILNQKYCANKKCQNARRKKWIKYKLKHDKEYKTYRQEIQNKWKAKNLCYWTERKKNLTTQANTLQEENRKIKILVEKDTLADLSKMGVINCHCQLIIAPKVKPTRTYDKLAIVNGSEPMFCLKKEL